jgi:hypothetical protein
MCLEDRPVLEQNAAGIDIGSREIFVAVPPDRDVLQELESGLLRLRDHG